MRRTVTIIGGCAALALALAAPARAGEGRGRFQVDSFAEVMDPGTVFYLEIPNFARAREAYRATPRWNLWWRGAGRRLIETWIRSTGDEDFSASIRAFVDSLDLLQGRVAFAMGPYDAEAEMPAPVFLAEAGDRAGELKRIVEKMAAADADADADEILEAELGGIRFTQIHEEILLGAGEGLFIAGLGSVNVGALVAKFDERPWQNLAASQAFRMAKRRALEGAHFFAFTNYSEIWKLFRMDDMMMDEEEIEAFEKSGLFQLAATAHSGRFTPDGVIDKLSFILRGRARGIWKLMEPEPLTRGTWKVLPDFTSGFVSVRWDLVSKVKPFLDIQRAIDEDIEKDTIEFFSDLREGTGVSFDGQLLPLTTGEITLVCFDEPPGPAKWEDNDAEAMKLWLIAVELANPAEARRVMDRLTRPGPEGDGPAAERQRFGELHGWHLEFDTHWYVAGHDGVAFLALSPKPLERMSGWLQAKGKRLVDTEEFRRATEWIPQDTGFAAYSNSTKILRSLHELMKAETRGPLPTVKALLEGAAPLTAALHIEKPGFAFEVRSPDGFFAFYMQLVAHMIWRFEVEPMQERRAERRAKALRRLGADGLAARDAEMAARDRAVAEKRRVEADMRRREMAAHERALAAERRRAETERHLREMLARRARDQQVRQEFTALIRDKSRLKTPEEKVEFLERSLPRFAGTSCERELKSLIEGQRKVAALMARVGEERRAEAERRRPETERRRAETERHLREMREMRRQEMLDPARYRQMCEDFTTLIRDKSRLKTPEEKVELLEQALPRFAGTSLERVLQSLIEREKARAAPAPDAEGGDEDAGDVF